MNAVLSEHDEQNHAHTPRPVGGRRVGARLCPSSNDAADRHPVRVVWFRGEEIGPRVAEALGVTYHPQAFTSEQLEQAPDKRADEGLVSRVFAAMGGSYAALDGPSVAMAQRDDHELVLQTPDGSRKRRGPER